ncbi:cobalamin B12-binding domain-containing protein [Roseovarius sp. 2305UL8-3]|uniref:cobalamin B12-binding domain-containing protein n=1 Tax=Roseovarius conchicola TaxID=3121636 RepID=UPI0035275884
MSLKVDAYEQSASSIWRLKKSFPEDLVAGLAREVIQRLASKDSKLDASPQTPSVKELEAFCTALISDDDEAAAEIIIGIRAEGMSAELIYLKYLAAAARMLGEWWNEDRASFVEVTIGTGRMFAIMRGMRHLFTHPFSPDNKSAVFASAPGEDHTLGVRMAADIFRKNGWEITLKVGLDHDTLVSELEQTPSSIIGLSIGGRHSIDALSRLIVALHICCPNAPLVVCGQGIRSIKPILSLMGVDGIACDIEEAKHQMTELWDQKLAV